LSIDTALDTMRENRSYVAGDATGETSSGGDQHATLGTTMRLRLPPHELLLFKNRRRFGPNEAFAAAG
jgi:hypothetical protein